MEAKRSAAIPADSHSTDVQARFSIEANQGSRSGFPPVGPRYYAPSTARQQKAHQPKEFKT